MDKIELLLNEPAKQSPLLMGLSHPKYQPLTMVTTVHHKKSKLCTVNRLFFLLNITLFATAFMLIEFVATQQSNNDERILNRRILFKTFELESKISQILFDHRFNLGLIVNGEEVPQNEAKFQVQIRQVFPRLGVNTFCGGTLIAPQYVLTASHCFNPRLPVSSLFIRYGTHMSNSSKYEDVGVLKAIRHPYYDSKFSHNDIALLKLSEKIHQGENVEFAELDFSLTPAEEQVQIYGFGLENGTSTSVSTTLKKASLETLSVRECNNILKSAKYPTDKKVICANSAKQISCSGDSGGGLFNSKGHLIGITSLVESGCEPGGVAIFTRISSHYYFIAMNTKFGY